MLIRLVSIVVLGFATLSTAQADDGAQDRHDLVGMVTAPDGSPIEGARVDVSTAAPKIGRNIFCPSCYLDCGKWATTDQHGKFTITAVDSSLKFRLVVTQPGRRTLRTELLDPTGSPASLVLDELPANVDAARVVAGQVMQNGVPVAGALVEPHGAKMAGRRWWGQVDGVEPTVTDSDGKFFLILPPEFLAIDIRVTGYGFCGEQLTQLEPGRESLTIEVRTGASVIGKLEHQGQPVAGMSIAVVQLERSTMDSIFIAAIGDVTDADGSFEFHYLPPSQRYCIYSIAGEAKRSISPYVITTKTFSVPATGQTRDLGPLDVILPTAIHGKVLRVDDQPLPDNLQLSLGRDPAWDLIGIPVKEDGTFVATGLPPETYEIRVNHRELVIVADDLPYQTLSDASLGIRLGQAVDNLVIPVRARK